MKIECVTKFNTGNNGITNKEILLKWLERLPDDVAVIAISTTHTDNVAQVKATWTEER